MQAIREMGAEIERRWGAAGRRPDAFVALAEEALRTHQLHQRFAADEVLGWLLSATDLPAQPVNDDFGEPPVLLFRGAGFYLEALFWLDGTTAIHRHGFSGAFQVLAGSSLHTRYRFAATEAVCPGQLLLGDLRAGEPELLQVGDIRAIASGDRLIHSLFHLDRPSVTLVVRTEHDAGAEPQYSYHAPGIAFDPFRDRERRSRIVRLLGVLRESGGPSLLRWLQLMDSADLPTAALTLVDACRARPLPATLLADCLARLAGRHAALAAALGQAIDEVRRQALVIDLRRTVHRPEHRFLLSLLLNVHGRDRILGLIAARAPGLAPLDQLLGWLTELAALPPPAQLGEGAASALGYDLGEIELRVLRGLLAGEDESQIVAALAQEYDDVAAQEPALRALCAELRAAALFRPLFAPA